MSFRHWHRSNAFEGQQPFVASEGDVVYVPANTWHATRFFGADPACRLSIYFTTTTFSSAVDQQQPNPPPPSPE